MVAASDALVELIVKFLARYIAQRVALVSITVALSQTPAYTVCNYLHQAAPIYLLHPGCSNCQTESSSFSSAWQPRRLILHDESIWTKKFHLFRADSMELTAADS